MKELLKFSASWCGPCKSLHKIMSGANLGVNIKEVDIDDNPDLAVHYGIRSVPTLVLLEDGKEVKRMFGVKKAEELKEWLS